MLIGVQKKGKKGVIMKRILEMCLTFLKNNRLGFFIFSFTLALACIPAEEKITVFAEDFAKKDSKWYELKDGLVDVGIRNGGYYFSYNMEGFALPVWVPRFKLDTNKDFGFEVSVASLTEDSPADYGLVFGARDRLANYFCIKNNGVYNIYSVENSKYVYGTDWITSQAIKTGEKTNILMVRRKDEKLLFYINGTEIHSMDYKPFYGPWYALRVRASNTIVFDDLHVYNIRRVTLLHRLLGRVAGCIGQHRSETGGD